MVLNSLGNKISITSWAWVNRRRLKQEGVITEAINMKIYKYMADKGVEMG